MKNRRCRLLVMATRVAITTGCSKDPDKDKEPDPTFSLSPATTAVVFSAKGSKHKKTAHKQTREHRVIY